MAKIHFGVTPDIFKYADAFPVLSPVGEGLIPHIGLSFFWFTNTEDTHWHNHGVRKANVG